MDYKVCGCMLAGTDACKLCANTALREDFNGYVPPIINITVNPSKEIEKIKEIYEKLKKVFDD